VERIITLRRERRTGDAGATHAYNEQNGDIDKRFAD